MATFGAYSAISSGTSTGALRRNALIAQSRTMIATPFQVNPANHEPHHPEKRLAHARWLFIVTATAGRDRLPDARLIQRPDIVQIYTRLPTPGINGHRFC